MNIRIALSEACNNAVQYANAAPAEVEVRIEGRLLTATVTDHGSGFDLPERQPLPEPGAESGRGLFLIREVMDTVHYHRSPEGNRLVMTRQFSAPS